MRSWTAMLLVSTACVACNRERASTPTVVSELHITDSFDLSKAAITGHVDQGIPADATTLYAVIQVMTADGTKASVDWIAMTDEGEIGLSTATVTLRPGQLVSVVNLPPGVLKPGKYKVGVHVAENELAVRPFRVVAAAGAAE
jgi:hypothetical protein